MAKQQSSQKQPTVTQTAIAAPMPFLQPRAFAEPNTAITENALQQPDLQAQIDQASTFGHSLGRINPCPLSTLPIQPKLTIGKVGDPYEQEADRVAAQVVQQINQPVAATPGKASVQRQAIGEEEELQMKPDIQRRSDVGGMAASGNLEASINQARGSGQGLSDSIRQPMEQAFGADFSSVRVHTDSQSDQLSRSINAQAFTTKNDVFFSKGKYNPGTRQGQELLAHELTHTIQQGGSTVQRKPSAVQPGRQLATQISRSPASSIQRLLWTPEEFYQKVVAYKPANSKAIPTLEKKLKEYYDCYLTETAAFKDYAFENTMFFRRHRLEDLKEVSEGWIVDKGHEKEHPKASAGLRQFIANLNGEINELTVSEQSLKDNGTVSENFTTSYQTTFIDYVYREKIFAIIYEKICTKLGLNRGAWRRSKDLNKFRQALKDAARSQANEDIDSVLEEELKNANKLCSDETKEYYGVKSKSEAFETSKDAVNTIVKELAEEITYSRVPEAGTKKDLEEAAKKVALQNEDPQKAEAAFKKAIVAKANGIVKGSVGTTTGSKASGAIVDAREITKGAQTTTKQGELAVKVQDRVKKEEVGRKAVQQVIKADTLEKGFSRVAGLVDWAVPQAGDSCEVDIQIKVPIPNAGGAYFTTEVKGSAEKDEEDGKPEVNTVLEVTLGMGWSALGIIDASIQAGLFFDSKAETSQKALQLVSYGFYRKFQTANLDGKVANAVWGIKHAKDMKDASGQEVTTSGASAELWATAMEQHLFYKRDKKGNVLTDASGNPVIDEDAAVYVGGIAKGKAKGNVKFATAEGEASYRRGNYYNAATVGGGVGKKKQAGTDELKQAVTGRKRNQVTLKSEAEIEAVEGLGCGLEGKVIWDTFTLPTGKSLSRVSEFEVEGFGKLSSSLEKTTAVKQGVVAIGGSVASFLSSLARKYQDSDSGSVDTTGTVNDIAYFSVDVGNHSSIAGQSLGSELVSSVGEVEDTVKGIDEETGKIATTKAFELKRALKLGIKFGGERKTSDPLTPGAWECAFEAYLRQMKELSINIANVAQLKGESGKRIAQYKYSGGKHAGELVGFKIGK